MGPSTGNFSKFDEYFSDDLPKMQSMPPEEHLIRNLFRSQAETFSSFWRVFIGKSAKHAIYASGVVFSTKVIFWENYLFVYLFSEFEQEIFAFLSIFGSVVRIPFRVCRGTFRGKEFLSRKNKLNIVFGLWATKIGLLYTIGNVRKNCFLSIQRSIWSYFSQKFFECQNNL